MSPNLTPSEERFEVSGVGYEQVVFNVLQCVMGINNYADHHAKYF